MKKLTIGIDVSKDKLDYCILDNLTHEVVDRGIVDNNSQSIKQFIKDLDSNNTVLSFEHTGHYGALLAWILSEEKLSFYMINPLEIKRSMGIQRGKTDAIDAFRIASFTIRNNDRLKPFKLPTEKLRKLKALMTARDRYTKISVQLKNSLKANELLNKTVNLSELIEQEQKQIESIKEAIQEVEKQMQEVIKSEADLKKTFDKITSVIGVGPITAIKCIVETENFLKFTNGRKFSCHSGLAPFPYSSGSSIKGKTKTHHLRDKSLKAILFKAAGSAIQHDPQLKRYYNRKIEEGKVKLCVLNAVANKLVLRIFAVAKREQPYVKLTA